MKRMIFVALLLAAIAFIGSTQVLKLDAIKAPAFDTNAPPINLPAKIAEAKSDNKLLLLEFGSSDACPPCVVYQKKVFSTPQFTDYEKSNLVFVRVDFPFNVNLPPAAHDTNDLLATQFKIFGYPTFIALGKDGKEIWRMPKSPDETPDLKLFDPTNFIALVEQIKTQEK